MQMDRRFVLATVIYVRVTFCDHFSDGSHWNSLRQNPSRLAFSLINSKTEHYCSKPVSSLTSIDTLTMPATAVRNWKRPDHSDSDSEWEAFLNTKKQAMSRMKAGRMNALNRLTVERAGGRSVISELSDDREAGDHSVSMDSEMRDAPETIREEPEMETSDLDMHQLIEIFTVIKKRKWDDFMNLIHMYPQAPSAPCPQNIQSTAKGNLMLHEVCRNNPPLQVIDALVNLSPGAVKAKGGKGYLPLHYACATDASPDIVQTLLDAFPASIRMRDTNDLMIPLHFACKWGASAEIVEILNEAYPEGKQVRDIYAKTPVDYASALREEQRNSTLRILERSLHSQSTVSYSAHSNDTSVSEVLSEAVSMASRQIHQELTNTKAKLNQATLALSEKERKFAIQVGAEQSKASELQLQKNALEIECANAKVIQDEQKEKIELLREEVATLKSLQEVHEEKKTILLKKINELEQEKTTFSDVTGKDSAQIKKELTATMVEQEIKFKAMLAAEQRKIDELEKKSNEAEVTHRNYTMALLQEHEQEVTRFQELTSRFKVLEGQLRQEIENERNKRVAIQNATPESSALALESEKEKVAFLEAHISKVNDLLEAEQKRFIELESILKETLAIESEQREEIEAEFKERETQYMSRIEIESQKREQLENAYTEVAEKLKDEVEKSSSLQAYENELKKELEEEQKKVSELQKMQEKSEKALEKERQRVKEMAATEANSRLLLKTEELKVQELQAKLDEMRGLLEKERENVKALKIELEGLSVLYNKEKQRIEDAKVADTTARTELRSLSEHLATLETEESHLKTQLSKFEATKEEYERLQSNLEHEKDQINKILGSQTVARAQLLVEKEKLQSLEALGSSHDEEELMEQQAALDDQKYRVRSLEGKLTNLAKELEIENESTKRLEISIAEKKTVLDKDSEIFELLKKEHGEMQVLLSEERSKVKYAQIKSEECEKQLSMEKKSFQEMQRMVDQTKIDLQSKTEEVSSLEKVEQESKKALEASMKDFNASTEESSTLSEALIIEKQRVTEMATALKEVQDLVQEEKNRVAEFKRLLEAQKLMTVEDREKIIELERIIDSQLMDLGFGKEENEKLEMDLAETKRLLDEETKKVQDLLGAGHKLDGSKATEMWEAEQNKVKALEDSCEQLMSMLELEKNHSLALEEKCKELSEEVEANKEEIAELKKALEKSQLKALQLAHEVEGYEQMKQEVVRLTFEARQRDVMIAALLHVIGDNEDIKGRLPVQMAEKHINAIESRAAGINLIGYSDELFQEQQQRQLVAYNAQVRRRTVRNIILPIVAAGALVEYHHHDPRLFNEVANVALAASAGLRHNMHILGNLSRSMGASFTANMGNLAATLSASGMVRDTAYQGIGGRRTNFRKI